MQDLRSLSEVRTVGNTADCGVHRSSAALPEDIRFLARISCHRRSFCTSVSVARTRLTTTLSQASKALLRCMGSDCQQLHSNSVASGSKSRIRNQQRPAPKGSQQQQPTAQQPPTATTCHRNSDNDNDADCSRNRSNSTNLQA